MTEDDKPASGLDATVGATLSAARAGAGSAASAAATAPRSADVPLAPGATLGRYVLVEALGAGGMGMVFRARDPDLGREVAIKVLRAGDGSGGGLERRLLREAQAMATVTHDNLANVYDIGTAGGRVFIAMELVDGGTLRARFADASKTWRDKLAAVVSAGRGLAAAHSAGVIHRDFKPDNVLVAKNGRVKVVDFGLARADRDAIENAEARGEVGLPADLSAQLTQTGALLGTPAYMAPEQHAGEPVDARSDQFGFAVTAWEAVYGARPFVSDAYSSLVAAVRSHQITPPPKVAGVPAALEAALRRALSPAPSDRFTSMDALLDAIERATQPRRSRTPWIAAGAAVALAGGGIGLYAALDDPRPPPVTKPSVQNKLGSGASGVRVRVLPFDLSNLHEFQRGGNTGDAAVERMQISRALDTHGAEIGACFDEAGADRDGRISIQFTIQPDGRVASVQTTEDGFPGTGIASCVGSKAMTWTFPPADDGQARVVTFPFQFSVGPGSDRDWPGDLPFDPDVHINVGDLAELALRMQNEIEQVDDDQYTIPRHLANALASDPATEDGATYAPWFEDGKQAGYQLWSIKSGSLFDELDLEDGDIVRAINGTPLVSRGAATAAVAAAKTADRVVLDVVRDGEPFQIHVEVLPDMPMRPESWTDPRPGRTPASPPTPPVPPAPAPAPAPAP